MSLTRPAAPPARSSIDPCRSGRPSGRSASPERRVPIGIDVLIAVLLLIPEVGFSALQVIGASLLTIEPYTHEQYLQTQAQTGHTLLIVAGIAAAVALCAALGGARYTARTEALVATIVAFAAICS